MVARIIPNNGPVDTNSKAERELYEALRDLGDEFTVIHSFPWLNSAITTLDKSKALMGETDFIVLHPSLGILAIEVKGGHFSTQNGRFIYVNTGAEFDPFRQLQKGVFTLDKYVKKSGLKIRIGKAFFFPDVFIPLSAAPPILKDVSGSLNSKIYIDASERNEIQKRIIEIMKFWRTSLPPAKLTQGDIKMLVDLISPSGDNTATWEVIINHDRRRWLKLTSEQKRVLDRALSYDLAVVNGRPGTGKTLLAVEIAKRKYSEGKKVLFITYNRPLVDEKLRKELKSIDIYIDTFHGLCYHASLKIGRRPPQGKDKTWFNEIAPQNLRQAVKNSCLEEYDLLIIDEGQALKLEWIKILKDWIPSIYIFCDSSQSFNYEPKTMPEEIASLLDAQFHGILTAAIRTLPEVHERLEKAIPDSIQQISLRDYENGRVDERVILSSVNDELEGIIKDLYNEGALPEHIVIVHNSSFPPEISDKRIKIDTSARIRGLEYPVVICVNISPDDEAQLINAYTRATTKVIAIYSVSLLNSVRNLERFPFFQQILEKPEIINALADKQELLMRSLGWKGEKCEGVLPFSLTWLKPIGMWLISSSNNDSKGLEGKIESQKEEFLLKSLSYLSGERVAKLHYTPAPSLTVKFPSHENYHFHSCPKCNKMALAKVEFDSETKSQILTDKICSHCVDTLSKPIPNLKRFKRELQILESPNSTPKEKISLTSYIMAIGILKSLISTYPAYKKPILDLLYADVDIVVPRLIVAQIFLGKGLDSLVTMDKLVDRVKSWTNSQEMTDYVKQSSQLWTKRGWIKRVKRDHYLVVLNFDRDKVE